MLSVSGLSALRVDRTLFSKLSFTLNSGQCLHLRGANGAGKTTLLKLLTGLNRPQSGEIYWQQQALPSLGEQYAAALHYLGHKDGLKELLSPYANLRMAAELAGQPLSDEAALQALAKVGLSHQCDLAVRSLSQGQKKRAALAKLLALPRPLWLLDEPFVALDTQAQDQLGGWISQQLSSGGLVILTSHQTLPTAISQVIELDLALSQGSKNE
ncbi:cytochrome c biogenesis heme-transporting ATPase CcmA [Iodobacter fluviatilis]|jgi:heme exporter protein A|uniref:Heme ABC transporter ATP-binding protein CcmA n=1 Tax=Iodobacter fluviatilis TaxID=537 RepID=A0A7G3GBV4_9NEIS|nr:cytochrome c biogenesis heme-transporting ATPase CcmA [Iodobacter fluviatilis]QBC45050.1 heme ABC transporter ATP-binding protein CcmA [Iodobacter fluviatilis]